jgi:transposase-like protein
MYTAEDKQAAIALVVEQLGDVVNVAKEIGMPYTTLHGWAKKADVLTGNGPVRVVAVIPPKVQLNPEAYVLAFESRVVEFADLIRLERGKNEGYERTITELRRKMSELEANAILRGVGSAKWRESLISIDNPLK